ncbi:MAG: signal recognition particle protein [Rhodobacteraceae bacterium]|nr:signal recognition particle protein [Paracoccaceae bacterium]
MFESLSDRFSAVFERVNRKGALNESDISAAMREVRISLIEADVALPIVKSFIKTVQRKASGQAVYRSVSPGQQVIKIVHDELKAILAGDQKDHILQTGSPPSTILMVGLQGSGKTTTTAKLAKFLTEKRKKKVLMASLDTRRPAAMEQLAILGEKEGLSTLTIEPNQSASEIAERALRYAKISGFDVILLDTAGRMHVDNELMDEVITVRNIATPKETLLVVDGLTGQDAVNIASEFDTQIGITGVVLTRMEGDGRGGAALSMRATTGKPIKFLGVGEKVGDLTVFNPDRIANRILGMGDIVSLVEKAQETFEKEKTDRILGRFRKGRLNLNDLRDMINNLQKMGGFGYVTGMLPGFKGGNTNSSQLEDLMKKNLALINSMTRKERANPRLIQASHKLRIAAGAGLEVSDVNLLIKYHLQVGKIGKTMAKKGNLRKTMGPLFSKNPSEEDITAADINQFTSGAQNFRRNFPR